MYRGARLYAALGYAQVMAQIRREDLWRLQYREDRYMRDIPTADLLTRAGDLISAMLNSVWPHGAVIAGTQMELYSKTDFYVYCMAEACDARLFEDFGADACVVITDPGAFKTGLEQSISPLLADWRHFDAAVDYFDPYFARPHQMAPQLAKHFRFSYQKEYRLLWIPPCPEDLASLPRLEHLPFEVGPLTSYAKLITL